MKKRLIKLPKGMTELPCGVDIHGRTIRIVFYYNKQKCQESLKGLPINRTNIKYAAQRRAAILEKIATNTFDYAKEFPNSPRAKQFPAQVPQKVGDALDRWLALKKVTCAPSTVRGYEKDIRVHLKPRWEQYGFKDIKKTDLENWLFKGLAELGAKTVNNLAMPLRAVMKDACLDGVIDRNPFDHLKYLETDVTTADPFSSQELQRLLATPTERIQELNYIEFACFSGVSAAEGIAIAYEDIDWQARTVSIERACVMGVYKRPKKKKRQRTLKLFDQAYDALLRQKPYTFAQPPVEIDVLEFDNKTRTKELLRFVFFNSQTNQPYSDARHMAARFWTQLLKQAGLRQRGINQCRHTFASRLLSCGRYPEKWIAEYLGHTSTAMLHKHYGRWIGEDHPNLEKQASKDLAIERSVVLSDQAIIEKPKQPNEPGEHVEGVCVEGQIAINITGPSEDIQALNAHSFNAENFQLSPPRPQNFGNSGKTQQNQIVKWRRERDSNPRYAFNVYSLSRGAPSATRPSLRYL